MSSDGHAVVNQGSGRFPEPLFCPSAAMSLLSECAPNSIDIGAKYAKLASNSMRQHEGDANEEAATI